ncbi:MlaD family protein [Aliidiomarina indica]|uniref:MlaD family protein n=1 Tax=Aliidiomarina indica TaxID=2749147 RepID=UPI00188E55C8|nr:MlaD family protein [Aliidiomarina indica]
METRANYIVIGLLAILLMFGSVAGVLWLSKKSDISQYARYEVLFSEPVSGLSTGSPVQFSGIRVGEVESLRLDPNDARIVRARIQITASTPVDSNTRARLTLLNITGASGIELQPGRELADPQYTSQSVDVIEAEPSPFTRLRLSSEELLVKLGAFLDSTIELVSEENTEKLSNILSNLEEFSGNLNESTAKFDNTLEEVNRVFVQFSEVADKINVLIDDEGEATLADAREALTQFTVLAQRLNTVIQANEDSIQSGFDGLNEFGPTVSELRNAIATLGMILQQVDQDPAAYLFGREKLKEIQE